MVTFEAVGTAFGAANKGIAAAAEGSERDDDGCCMAVVCGAIDANGCKETVMAVGRSAAVSCAATAKTEGAEGGGIP